MAVISKIRSYSGLLIAVIGLALAAFVLGDFLGYGPMRTQKTDIGKIEDSQISYLEFESRVNENIENWKAQTGMQQVGQQEAFQIRQEVWNQMVQETLLNNQLDELGIEITSQELYDMVHGTDPHPWIVNSFTNPETGEYDSQQVISFLQNFEMLDPSVQNQWVQLEQFIKRERREGKYYSLIGKGFYVPQVMAAIDYQWRNATANIRYIQMPYNAIADSMVQVSDQELRTAYDENKNQYRQEESRSIEYVAFPVFPTEEDREALRREILELQEELETTQDMEGFINAVSDTRFNPAYLSRNEVSPEIEEALFEAPEGTIHGPYVEDNMWVLAKLHDVAMRPDSMNASHILISYMGAQGGDPAMQRNPERAQELADSLLQVARNNPNRFQSLAEAFSDDPSAATNQGDLGWFQDGEMVPEFNEAVVEGAVGSFTMAETAFGYHVIRITGKSPASRKIQLAKLTRLIEPSSRTYQVVYASASEFASALRQSDDFDETVAEQGLSKRVVDEIAPMSNNVPGIENPREIIRWAFDEETEIGSTSRIFDLDGRFIIANLTGIQEEGIPDLEDIREEIRQIVMRDKKFETMATQMREAMSQNNLEAAASTLGLQVRDANDLNFFMTNLPGAGAEPRVIGAAMALEAGEVSDPVKGNNGAYLAEVIDKQVPEVPENLDANKAQWQATFSNRVQGGVYQALRENADIEDNRIMFY
ncbi:MAG: SurA N-terminal domain-containing protein [Bacteroidales bacterium]